MRIQLLTFLTGIALAAGTISGVASSASVCTIPTGMITYSIAHGATTMLSLPLTNTETFTSTVNAVTSGTISVADAPAPFTKSLATPVAPYFVKFLSGNETGRVLLITSNTTSALTLDTTDNSTGSPIALDTTGFNVQPGDAFEIFPGDTLATIFGSGDAQNPLVIAGGPNAIQSDSVALFTSGNTPASTYYFNTTDNCWEQAGDPTNANNTIIYPYSAFAVNRLASNPDTTMVVSGRVTPVAAQTKLVSNGTIFTSTHYATDVKLSQLKFGTNWIKGANVFSADILNVWNPSANRFDIFYQKPDATWRKFPDGDTDQSNVAIAAGSVTAIAKHVAVTGSATFLQSPLPYSLD